VFAAARGSWGRVWGGWLRIHDWCRRVYPARVVRKRDDADQALQLGVLLLEVLPCLALTAPVDGDLDEVK